MSHRKLVQTEMQIPLNVAQEGICQIFRIVPLSIPDISPMRSEKGRVFAIRRCFKRKTPAKRKIEPKEEKQEAASGDVDTHVSFV